MCGRPCEDTGEDGKPRNQASEQTSPATLDLRLLTPRGIPVAVGLREGGPQANTAGLS